MKIYIIGNRYSKTKHLAKKLSDYYNIKVFSITNTSNLNSINNIVLKNKKWIIESNNITNINEISNLSENIIFLDIRRPIFKKLDDDFQYDIVYNQLKKHIRKGIIIKNKAELRKYLKSVYESKY